MTDAETTILCAVRAQGRTGAAVGAMVLGLALLSGCATTPPTLPVRRDDAQRQQELAVAWFLYELRGSRWQATEYPSETACRDAERGPQTFRYCGRTRGVWRELWTAHMWLEGTQRWSRAVQAFSSAVDCKGAAERMGAAGHRAVCERVY
jgi:hypothetical protein